MSDESVQKLKRWSHGRPRSRSLVLGAVIALPIAAYFLSSSVRGSARFQLWRLLGKSGPFACSDDSLVVSGVTLESANSVAVEVGDGCELTLERCVVKGTILFPKSTRQNRRLVLDHCSVDSPQGRAIDIQSACAQSSGSDRNCLVSRESALRGAVGIYAAASTQVELNAGSVEGSAAAFLLENATLRVSGTRVVGPRYGGSWIDIGDKEPQADKEKRIGTYAAQACHASLLTCFDEAGHKGPLYGGVLLYFDATGAGQKAVASLELLTDSRGELSTALEACFDARVKKMKLASYADPAGFASCRFTGIHLSGALGTSRVEVTGWQELLPGR